MSEAVDVEAVKAGPDWKKAKATFGSREWRLDNLYFIEDEKGETVLFQRNEAQRAYSPKRWWRDAIVKARQLGFSTFLAMLMLDLCIFRSGQRAAVVDVTLNDAKKKLAKIKFAYDRLPQAIRDAVPLIKANTEELQFGNGSHISVGTDYRGSTLQFLHISEFGKIASDTPARAEALKTGAMRAVHATGIIAVESTAHGTSGEFAGLVNRAKGTAATGAQLTALDYRLHFYGWWIKREYRLPNNLVLITAEHRKYFAEIAPKLLDRHGVVLDADQQAWYVKNLEDLGPDKMKEEFPSCIDGETLINSADGLVPIKDARVDGTHIVAKFDQGVKEAFTVTTRLGYQVVATEDHPFLCPDGVFRELKELNIGSDICLQDAGNFPAENQFVTYRPAPFVESKIEITERLALFLGIFMGDGSFYDRCISIACDAKDEDIVDLCRDLLTEVSGSSPSVRLTGSKMGCAELRISRDCLLEPFKAMGIVRQNGGDKKGSYKRDVKVPDFIFRSPRKVASAFLRGLFEADGFAQRNGSGIIFCGKGERFVRDVQLLLLQFGITARLAKADKKKPEGGVFEGWILSLRTAEAVKFSREIGFLSERKIARSLASIGRVKKRDTKPALPISYRDEIVSIAPAGLRHVFDITTPSHQFNAGGIIVHNCVEETFFNSLQGAFWKNELNKARAEGRIGQMVPWDPQRRVNTFSDIGEDCTAIIFHQTDGLRHRFIDYYEEEGWSLQGYCGKMDEKRRERGFIYGKHLGPHDFGHRVWGNHAKTKKDLAAELGVNVTVVPQISDKGISIEAARQMLNVAWVDAEHCALLVERWENYRKVWNKSLSVFTSDPLHDMASHGSDALQNGACGLAPEKVDKPRRHSFEAPRQTSQWSA